MNLYIDIFKKDKRSLIYSIILAFGFLISFTILESSPRNFYFLSGIILYVIVLFELYTTAEHYHDFHKNKSHAKYDFESHKSIQLAHHLFLPSALFFGLLFFTYFNNQPSIYFVIILLAFFMFLVLFENIHSYYKNLFSINKATNFVYDLITIILTFLWVNIIANLKASEIIDFKTSLILFGVAIGVLSILVIFRHAHSPKAFINCVVFIAIVVLSLFLFNNTELSVMAVSFIVTLMMQTYIIFVNQYLEHKLKAEDFLEYFIIGMLIIAILNIYNG